MLRNGRIGMVDRFTLYTSNLLPSGVAGGLAAGEFAIYAGHAHGLTFASQISKVETLRSEMTFGRSCAACRSTATRCSTAPR
jgi:hypothetical protein